MYSKILVKWIRKWLLSGVELIYLLYAELFLWLWMNTSQTHLPPPMLPCTIAQVMSFTCYFLLVQFPLRDKPSGFNLLSVPLFTHFNKYWINVLWGLEVYGKWMKSMSQIYKKKKEKKRIVKILFWNHSASDYQIPTVVKIAKLQSISL